ncbi:hypothetical protein [Acinetobacter sp. UBA3106]|uniref:hypothetical protein n=1 Tax=Acinetobacter sp. UBA3106 TaxID=1945936 RepID=UPI0025C1CF8F|nr:hypothetical protein [Acinetobacter sp. UBA3106]
MIISITLVMQKWLDSGIPRQNVPGDADSRRMADSDDAWKNTGPLQPNEPPADSEHQA